MRKRTRSSTRPAGSRCWATRRTSWRTAMRHGAVACIPKTWSVCSPPWTITSTIKPPSTKLNIASVPGTEAIFSFVEGGFMVEVIVHGGEHTLQVFGMHATAPCLMAVLQLVLLVAQHLLPAGRVEDLVRFRIPVKEAVAVPAQRQLPALLGDAQPLFRLQTLCDVGRNADHAHHDAAVIVHRAVPRFIFTAGPSDDGGERLTVERTTNVIQKCRRLAIDVKHRPAGHVRRCESQGLHTLALHKRESARPVEGKEHDRQMRDYGAEALFARVERLLHLLALGHVAENHLHGLRAVLQECESGRRPRCRF